MPAGWKHIREDLADEELRVYTTDHKRPRFWGIKPAGIGMFDFWEQNDPEIERYEDNIAMTWANPLIPPPVTTYDENIVMIWAGKGSNPDLTPSEPPTAKAPPATKAAAKPRRGRESSYVNTTHRVRKSTAESSKVKKNTRKSVVHKVDAGHSEFEDQMQEVTEAAHASDNSRRPQGRRPANAKSVAQNNISSIPKRLRGRPSTSTQPPANETDPIPSTRPRGRPPLKEKAIERPSKLKKKTPAIEGNARVTKSSQKKSRPSAPSTHKMRTRGEGPAELLQLHSPGG
ncbi:MAG: hypothetical protein Q9175_007219 [Cornicularia normoerica]